MTDQFATDSTTPTVSITTPAELIAAVPALLGFSPHESLVIITQQRRDGRGRLGTLARVDLPTDTATDQTALVAMLTERIAATKPDTVQLLVVTDDSQDSEDSPPARAELVDAATEAFTGAGMTVSGTFRTPRITAGAPWACYERCGCSGVVPDPGATELAAQQTLLGKVTYRSRGEVEDALVPEPASASARARMLLDAAHDTAAGARARDRAGAARADLDIVRAAAAAVGDGRRLDEDTLSRVAVALCDPAVRDVCLGFALGADPQVRPEHGEQLWWALTRATPGPEVAEPATLVAFTALLRGGGAPVRVALERAAAAHPGHRLRRLLASALDQAIDPDTLREIATGAVAKATTLLAP